MNLRDLCQNSDIVCPKNEINKDAARKSPFRIASLRFPSEAGAVSAALPHIRTILHPTKYLQKFEDFPEIIIISFILVYVFFFWNKHKLSVWIVEENTYTIN